MADMTISKDIIHIGASDKNIKIFENQYVLENGMSYNSYLIKDQKNVVLDTIDEKLTEKWLENLEKALEGEKPDYLVVSHMEPDHAYNIGILAKKYPDMKIVGNQITFNMLSNFFKEIDFSKRKFVVMEGDVLDIGKHKKKPRQFTLGHRNSGANYGRKNCNRYNRLLITCRLPIPPPKLIQDRWDPVQSLPLHRFLKF